MLGRAAKMSSDTGIPVGRHIIYHKGLGIASVASLWQGTSSHPSMQSQLAVACDAANTVVSTIAMWHSVTALREVCL